MHLEQLHIRAHGQYIQSKDALGQFHMQAHGQGRQAKHALGTVTYAGPWAGQTGKAYIGDSYTCRHMGRTDRQSMQWGQLHMWAHGQDRQAKRAAGTDTQD
jgi:hypothetical protein